MAVFQAPPLGNLPDDLKPCHGHHKDLKTFNWLWWFEKLDYCFFTPGVTADELVFGTGCFHLRIFLWRGLIEGSVAGGVSTVLLSPTVSVMIVIFYLL